MSRHVLPWVLATLVMAACAPPRVLPGVAPPTTTTTSRQAPGARLDTVARVVVTGQVVAPAGLIGNATGTLIGTPIGPYRLAASSGTPLAGTSVFLADTAGRPMPGRSEVKTDAEGRFTIPGVPAGGAYVVVALARDASGREARRRGLALATSDASPVTIDGSTTVVTAGVLGGRGGLPGRFVPGTYERAVATVSALLAAAPAPNWVDPEALLARFRELATQNRDLAVVTNTLREQLEVVSAVEAVEGIAPAEPVASPLGEASSAPLTSPATVAAAPDLESLLWVDRVAPFGRDIATVYGTVVAPVRPSGIGVHPAGYYFFTDDGSNFIRFIGLRGNLIATYGTGAAGYLDGPSAESQFNEPNGGTWGQNGSVYIADTGNHRIRQSLESIDKARGTIAVITTFAGTGKPGGVDGVKLAASFNRPVGVVQDTGGNFFVVEEGGHRVRRIAPDGTVSTVAGNGTPGFADGPGTSAQFSSPRGIAVDAAGTLYVADAGNHRVRAISPDGTVSTLAGQALPGSADGNGVTATFMSPAAVAIAEGGSLWVADTLANALRHIAPDGTVTTVVGGPAGQVDGLASQARLEGPIGIGTIFGGTLLIAEATGQGVRRVQSTSPNWTPVRTVMTLAGNGVAKVVDGQGTSASFSSPEGLGQDSNGNLLVTEVGGNAIRRVTPQGKVTTVYQSANELFKMGNINDVVGSPGGSVYVTSNSLSAIIRILPDGEPEIFAGGTVGNRDGQGTSAQFKGVWGLAQDSAGVLYLADMGNHQVRKVTPDGTVTTLVKSDILMGPAGIAVDTHGTVYVADAPANAIRKVAPDGTVSTVAGGSAAGWRDGPGLQARFDFPVDVALDRQGDLIVTERTGARVRKIALGDPTARVTTLASSPGYQEGDGRQARFGWVESVTVGTDGRIYVADGLNQRIRVLE